MKVPWRERCWWATNSPLWTDVHTNAADHLQERKKRTPPGSHLAYSLIFLLYLDVSLIWSYLECLAKLFPKLRVLFKARGDVKENSTLCLQQLFYPVFLGHLATCIHTCTLIIGESHSLLVCSISTQNCMHS